MSDIVSSLSPYVAKVEAWMKFVGLPYTKKIGTPATAPKGQVHPPRKCHFMSRLTDWAACQHRA